MINVAIVEDEKSASDLLEKYLAEYGEATGEEFYCRVYSDPISFLENYRADNDIVFLDIEMPLMNGMDAARRLRKADNTVAIIFVTNMAQYAVDGYEVSALDFIVKPVTYPVLAFKMKRILAALAAGEERKLKVTVGNNVECVDVSDLKYVEVLNHKLTYHLRDRSLTAYGQLKKLEESLPSHTFRRCNNYCLVNLMYVTSVNGLTVNVGKESLTLSEGRKKEFMRALADYLGGTSDV
jgi:hypothetical protein